MSEELLTREDVAALYQKLSGQWILIEVREKDGITGKAEKFIMIAHAENKDKLYALMDDDAWDWDREYLFVFADPDAICDI